MSAPDPLSLLQTHLPAPAVRYAYDLWQAHPFAFRVARPRRTRLGDYCYAPERGHVISVNANLPAPAFLITYLHEVAHRIVYERYGRRTAPHGAAWKTQFRDLLQPVLNEAIFSPPVLAALRSYARNPGATTASCPALVHALRELSPTPPPGVPLTEVPEGDRFELNGKLFTRGPLRRSRYLCTEQTSGRRYAVAASALVRKEGSFR